MEIIIVTTTVIFFLLICILAYPYIFPELDKFKDVVYKKVDHKYPTDAMIDSAHEIDVQAARAITERGIKNGLTSDGSQREYMAIMYMVEKAAEEGKDHVIPGVDPPYECEVLTKLQRAGFKIEPYGANTYKISWTL